MTVSGPSPASQDVDLLTTPVRLLVRRELTRESPSVRLAADQLTTGSMPLRLRWTPRVDARGGWAHTDVHLGCLWQLSDGGNGAMQALGGAQPIPPQGPATLALGERSEEHGESITLSLDRLDTLKRLVLYVYARSGRPDWSLGPHLSMVLPTGASIVVQCGTPPPSATICALASLHKVGNTLVVRRENEFLRGQQSAVTAAYGFDIGWADAPSR